MGVGSDISDFVHLSGVQACAVTELFFEVEMPGLPKSFLHVGTSGRGLSIKWCFNHLADTFKRIKFG